MRMLNEAICNHKTNIVVDKGDDRTKNIIAWLSRIEKSECTITEFFDKYNVPFSRSQYYLYKSRLKEFGESEATGSSPVKVRPSLRVVLRVIQT